MKQNPLMEVSIHDKEEEIKQESRIEIKEMKLEESLKLVQDIEDIIDQNFNGEKSRALSASR